MRAAQAVMGDLAASGLTPAQLALVMELSAAVATEARPAIDRAAENKRAYDREYRKAHPRAVRTKSYERNEPIGSNERDNLTSHEDLPQEAKASLPQGAQTKRTAVLWPCPAGVNPSHWRDFLANRKRKRCAQSQTALDGVLADIDRIADDEWPPGRLVQHAAAKGWASINDPRESKYGERPDHKRSNWETALAANMGSSSFS